MAAESRGGPSVWRRLLPVLTLLGLVAAIWHAAAVTAAERGERSVVVVADQNAFAALLGAGAAGQAASAALRAYALRAGGAGAIVAAASPEPATTASPGSSQASATSASAAGATGSATSATAAVPPSGSAALAPALGGASSSGAQPGAAVPSGALVGSPSPALQRAAARAAAATPGPALTAQQFFDQLKAAGADAVGVSEAGLGTFVASGAVALVDGGTWVTRVRAGLAPAPAFPLNPQATYVLVGSHSVAQWLRRSLPAALGPQVPVHWYKGPSGMRVAMIPMSAYLLAEEPLGFAPGSFRLARDAGLAVVPRPANSIAGLSRTATQALLRSVAAARVPVATVVFSGAATQPIPGGVAAAKAVGGFFRAQRWPLGIVLLSGGIDLLSPGMNHLAAQLPGALVRVYSVPALASFAPAETRRLAQDIRASNARVVYIHPVVGAADPVTTSLAYVASLTRDLRAQGLTVGARPALLRPLAPGRLQWVLQAVGASAGVAWLLCLWVPGAPERRVLAAGGVSLVVLAVLALLGGGGAAAVGVLGAIVAAGLGAAAAARVWRDGADPLGTPFHRALWLRSALTAVTWAAALAAGGLFSVMTTLDAQQLLGWPASDGLRTVHLASLLLTFVAFAVIVGPGAQGWAGVLRRLTAWIDRPVTFSIRDAVLVVLALGVVYALRHKGIDLWVYDLRAPWRELTTRFLLAPPSERAAVIGFPAVVVAGWAAWRHLRWPFCLALLVAAYGMAPFFDLFSAGVVPLPATLLGTVVQALVGLAVAAVVIAVAAGVGDWLRRRRRVGGPTFAGPATETLQPGP